MALSVKDPETDALVRRLAQTRQVSFTDAIRIAVSNELARERKKATDFDAFWARIQALQVPAADLMSAEEADAFMYDEHGLPH